MSDLIDRQAAINEFLHFADEHDGNDGLWHWTGIKAILESLPSAQPQERAIVNIKIPDEKLQEAAEMAMERIIAAQPNWIPCSERLPDYDGYDEVITTVQGRHENVTYKNGVCTNVEYDDIDKRWYINGVFEPNITVIAWMPLPESYQGE